MTHDAPIISNCSRPTARRAPAADHAAWRGADARLHAGRHSGRDEGRALARGARGRHRYRARQYLPFDAAAGRRAHCRARRLAEIYRLERPDADRFRRLPGDVAGAVAQGRRARGDLPLAYRRRQASNCRRNARSRCSFCSAPISPCSSTNACGCRPSAPTSSGRCSFRCAGRSAASAPSRPLPRDTCCSASPRAATCRNCAAPARGPGRHRFSRLRHRRPCGRRTASGDAGDDRGGRADPAAGSSALFDGRRHAGRPARGGRARHRHVRLRDADPQRPSRHGVHAVRSDQSAQRPPRRRSAAARRGKQVAVDVAAIRAPICIISSSRARRWARCCCRKSISPITSG